MSPTHATNFDIQLAKKKLNKRDIRFLQTWDGSVAYTKSLLF